MNMSHIQRIEVMAAVLTCVTLDLNNFYIFEIPNPLGDTDRSKVIIPSDLPPKIKAQIMAYGYTDENLQTGVFGMLSMFRDKVINFVPTHQSGT
jgi:hypothetical protein